MISTWICGQKNMILSTLLFIFFVISSTNFGVLSVKMKNVIVPSPVENGQNIQLKCAYDLEGSDLYSIKWYKNGQEFYRYIPKENPSSRVFDTEGINVDLDQTSMGTVYLKKVKQNTAGYYKCEVSGDAPDFQTQSVIKKMDVYVLPKKGPTITGGKKRYQVGDFVDLNCTSGKSKPAAKLSWYINDQPAPRKMLKEYQPVLKKRGLKATTLGLSFDVQAKHLIGGRIDLKCIGVVGSSSKAYKESIFGGYRSTLGSTGGNRRDNTVMSVSQRSEKSAARSIAILQWSHVATLIILTIGLYNS